MPAILKKILKILLWILAGILGLFVLIVLLIRMPSVQNYIVGKVEPMIEKKIGTPFNIERVYISFPKNITLEGLYVEDQKNDTLVSIDYLEVNIGLFGLLNNEVNINNVLLENSAVNLFKDSVTNKFNFDFIIESFQGDTTQPEEPKQPWKINAGGLELKDFRFSFIDQTSLLDIRAKLAGFDLNVDRFNLDSLDFGAEEFRLTGAYIDVGSFGGAGEEEVKSDTAGEETTKLTLSVDNLEIENSKVQYADSSQKALANISMLLLEGNTFSLHKQEIGSDLVELKNSFVHYEMFITDTATQKTETETGAPEPWKINVARVSMEKNEARFDREQPMDTISAGMDFNYLHINGLLADIRDISITGSDISSNIESLQFSEKSGFALNEFEMAFEMTGERITVNDLHLKTKASSLSASTVFYSTAFTEHQTDNNPSSVVIESAEISPEDIFYFVPQLRRSIPINQSVILKGEVKGWLDDLNVETFTASLDSTIFGLQGRLTGLPEMQKFHFDVPKVTFKGEAKTIRNVLPDTVLPASLQLPDEMDITATVRGSLNDLQGSFTGVTSFGNLYFEGSFKNDTIEKYLDLNGDFEIEDFDVGKLIQNQQMGKLAANFSVDGTGQDFSNADIDINGAIALFEYNDYNYENLKINGNINGQSYAGKLSSEDKNLRFYFDGLVDMKDSIPAFDLRLDLIHADLQALNFMPHQFIASGVVTADIEADQQGRINGKAAIRKAKIIKEGEFFAIDSIIAVSVSEERKTDIKLNSGIVDAHFTGNIDINKIGSILTHHFDQYFSEELSTDSVEAQSQTFEFSVNLVDPTILTDVFLPALDTLNISTIEGSFNNRENRFTMEVNVPQVIYGGFELDTLTLNVNSNNRRLTGELRFALLKNEFLYIDNFSLVANSAENALNLLLTIPLKNKNDFQLGTKLYREDSAYLLSMRSQAMVFNGTAWSAPEDNYVKLSPGLWFNNFTMQNGNKHLTIDSRVNENDTTLYLGFQNFDLKNLTEPISDSVSLASGLANGSVSLLGHDEGLSINTDLKISDLSVLNGQLGNLTLNTNYQNGENAFDFGLKGAGADIAANGTITGKDTTTQIETEAEINKLELSVIYPFVKEYFGKLTGQLSGNVSFKTTEAFPEIDGRINFDNVNLTPTLTGVEVKIDNEQIRINNENVALDNFRINAVDGGSIAFDGNLNASNFPDFQVSLGLTADNFKVLNTTEDDNETYYGKLLISGKANVSGNQDLLTVDADVQVDDGSELVYVVPQQQSSVISAEGLVRYIDVTRDTLGTKLSEAQEDTAAVSIQGIDLTANIAINKESKLSVIIDQQTGDRLNVAGDANLTLAMPPAGDMSLTGRYEISEGSYNLNFYEFVKREFEIVEGSSILWTGDPLEAQLNVTTRYIVETLPPVVEINKRIPFYVNLMINEEILDPQLSFSLSLPEELQAEYEQVYSFLQNINSQETELNKQVFSLIVFNSFMVSGGAGSGDLVSNTARQSLSKILSQQLNRLAGNVNFVDLDVNLESYETGGAESAQGRTDLELGLSKSLFNNRVTVRIEGNVNLEGEEQSQQGMSNYSGDIIIEYKLTKDGVYRLQVFSKEEYDALTQDQITKTGVGVIMVRDYNNVKDLFKREKKAK